MRARPSQQRVRPTGESLTPRIVLCSTRCSVALALDDTVEDIVPACQSRGLATERLPT